MTIAFWHHSIPASQPFIIHGEPQRAICYFNIGRVIDELLNIDSGHHQIQLTNNKYRLRKIL
jgi:hypothetical protein